MYYQPMESWGKVVLPFHVVIEATRRAFFTVSRIAFRMLLARPSDIDS